MFCEIVGVVAAAAISYFRFFMLLREKIVREIYHHDFARWKYVMLSLDVLGSTHLKILKQKKPKTSGNQSSSKRCGNTNHQTHKRRDDVLVCVRVYVQSRTHEQKEHATNNTKQYIIPTPGNKIDKQQQKTRRERVKKWKSSVNAQGEKLWIVKNDLFANWEAD